MNFETLQDWCKWLEKNFSNEQMIPTLPVIIRLDGNNFSDYTKKLQKPFDEGLVNLMIETTAFLVKETNAVIGYTQSDEITLILYNDDRKIDFYQDGKKQKILSKLTGKCVSFFNEQRPNYIPTQQKIANFDCRIYQVPSLGDACSQLLWRENDATRNSIFMLAQTLYTHQELFKLHANQVQDKMFLEKGINWNDLPEKYKKGTYIKKIKTQTPFSKEELAKLPPQHNAHKNPDLVIERNEIKIMEYPIFNKIKNKVEVVFEDAKPILGELQ